MGILDYIILKRHPKIKGETYDEKLDHISKFKNFGGTLENRYLKRSALLMGPHSNPDNFLIGKNNRNITLGDLFRTKRSALNGMIDLSIIAQARQSMAYNIVTNKFHQIIDTLDKYAKQVIPRNKFSSYIIPHYNKFRESASIKFGTLARENIRKLNLEPHTLESIDKSTRNFLMTATIRSSIRNQALKAAGKDILRAGVIGLGTYFLYKGIRKSIKNIVTGAIKETKKPATPLTLVGRAEHNRRISQGLLASKKLKHKVR